MPDNNRPDKRQNKTEANNREEMPGGARSMNKKDPPPHTRNAPQTEHAERNTPRSKR